MFSSKTLPLYPTLALAALLAGCGPAADQSKRAEPSAPPLAVHAQPAAVVNLPETYEATGTVRARVTTLLSARTTGRISEVRVQSGDSVKAGQVVAVLDARDLEAALRQAEAAHAEAQDALPEVDSAVAAAQAQLELAEATFRRMKMLFDEKSITEQEFDEAQARLKTARAGREMSQARRRQLEARIRQAGEGVAQARLQASFAQVTAPFAGTVIERKAEPGMLASPGTPIVSLEQSGAYRLEAAVDETKLGRIRIGTPARVELAAFDRQTPARVSEIVPALDAPSHSFTVKIDLPGQPGLRSGLFGRALFEFATRPALVVPVAALVSDGQVTRIYVADGGVARGRLVSTGVRAGDQVEILSGLSAGEVVIAAPPPVLSDGARIEVRP
ncbi:MAG: efflux RND transporter periplasmic adaptor subunit [Bryobacteraceae bacterium]